MKVQCDGADLSLFFVDGWGETDRERVEYAARRYCAPCPLRAACDARADERKECGLWGGAYRVRSQGRYTRRPLIPEAAAQPAGEPLAVAS